MRAGAQALSLLSVPLNVELLTALAEEPKSLIDLRRAVGSPPQTTMRGRIRALAKLGVLERRRQDAFPGSVDYELDRAGRDLVAVAETLEAWLAMSPEGPLSLGHPGAKSAIKALVDGWSTGIIRALASRPLSLTELNRLISDLSYPSLERRLGAMRLTGQIEACAGQSRRTPYAVTDWLRRAVGPLVAGASWESRYMPEQAPPMGRIDVESVFLLALPLLRLPADLAGSCRLAAEVRRGGERQLAGAMVEVQEGRIASCVSRLEGSASAWAAGSVPSWLSAMTEGDTDRLEVGGDCELGLAVVEGLHGVLYGAGQSRSAEEDLVR